MQMLTLILVKQATRVCAHACVVCLMPPMTSPWVGNKDKAAAIFSVCLSGCKSAIKRLINSAVL